MATKASITQPETYEGNQVASQYVNRVVIAANGTMTVTQTPVVKANILTPLPDTTTIPSTTNQIVGQTVIPPVTATQSPKVVTVDPTGYLTNPQPPGPPN